MKTKTSVRAIFACSLERAFKTPMLCAISKVHTGYGLIPKVTHCTDDAHWGQPGSTKKVYVAKSYFQNGGLAATDTVLERVENSYWKIEVRDFHLYTMGLYKFIGEWKTTALGINKVQVDYTYTVYSNNFLVYPFQCFFTHIFWKKYMKRVLDTIRTMAKNEEPYLYE